MRITTLLCVLSLPGALLALPQGTYTTFGVGCRGTGGPGCPSNNANGGLLGPPQNTNTFAIEVQSSTPILVQGFDFYTSGRGNTQTMATHLYRADPQNTAPLPTAAVSSTMTIGSSPGWYATTFKTPFAVPAGRKFFLSYTPNTSAHAPFVLGGGNWPSWVRTPTSTRWTGPSPAPWAFKVRCLGNTGSVPQLSSTGAPTIGRAFKVGLALAKANSAAGLILGASKTNWAAIKLPFDLSPLGAVGCSLLVSFDLVFVTPIDPAGNGGVNFVLPNDRALVGKEFHNQYFVIDAPANALGLAFSNGGSGKIG